MRADQYKPRLSVGRFRIQYMSLGKVKSTILFVDLPGGPDIARLVKVVSKLIYYFLVLDVTFSCSHLVVLGSVVRPQRSSGQGFGRKKEPNLGSVWAIGDKSLSEIMFRGLRIRL